MKKIGFLAADVSKGYADFTLWDHEGKCLEPAFKLMDNKEGHLQIRQLVKDFMKRYSINELYAGMESTGGYENNWLLLFKSMSTQGVSRVMRINPKAVKAMGTARMVRTVTDAVSADNIAQYMFSFANEPKVVYNQDNGFKTVRHVGAWIRNINKQITQTSNHLEKLVYQTFPELLLYCRHGFPVWLLNLLQKYPLPSEVIKAGKSRLAKLDFITEEKAAAIISKAKNTVAMQEADELLSATIKGMVTLLNGNRQQIVLQKKALVNQFKEAHEVQLLDSIPGIAEETAILLMMDIESIDNYSCAKQLCAQFGMHPTFKQSGDGTWAARLSKMGRSSVRGLLYMPALAAIRSNEYFKTLYAQQRAKGKKHRQAICVVMHKMLCIAFGVLKSKTPFNIEIHSKNQQQGEQKQKEAEIKQQQHNKEKKTKRERYMSINELEAPISRKQSKRIKKELPVPIDKNQHVRDREALNKDKQIPCLSS
ncbi:MAG TPA: IS110 family transposase [Segetibacter sp.]